jgi:predicted anti-sigma-YlaC factor YlaD
LGALSDYLDGEAEQRICEEIERHMANCEKCRAVINTLDRTVSIYREIPAPKAPAEVEETLWRVLRLPPDDKKNDKETPSPK